MSEQPNADLRDPEILDRWSDRGMALYHEKLKKVLEAEYDGQIVAIHVESGDYEVRPSAGDALRALRNRHSKGFVLTLDIGQVPGDDLLTLRMRSQHFAAHGAK